MQRRFVIHGVLFHTDCVQFVEYDQRAHRLVTLASFSFWVSSRLTLLKLQSPVAYMIARQLSIFESTKLAIASFSPRSTT